ncbi:hypothetical protein PG999_003023 [Apiospora kogelbergensis]|uniref:ATP-binding cassette, subfamily B n=1 Tax=Apiospora kogelbergensis TaxID=1337665 RepID=A0AAW0RA11_9PEZI
MAAPTGNIELGDIRPSPPSPSLQGASETGAGGCKTRAVPPDGFETPLAHRLTENEAVLVKRQVGISESTAGAFALYRYASKLDLAIILLSCITAIASGAAIPLMVVLFGNVQSAVQGYFQGNDVEAFSRQLNGVVLYFVYLAVANFVASYIYTVGFTYTAEHITCKLRESYLDHCLRQNIAFFDNLGAGDMITRITVDNNVVQEMISQKMGLTLAGASTFIAAYVVGFIVYWKLTLILLCALVLVVINMTIGSVFMAKYSARTIESYDLAAGLASEAISSIRTTIAFGRQKALAAKFDAFLKDSETLGFRTKLAMALMTAGLACIVNLGYALAFWIGGHYVVYDGVAVSKVIVTVMVVFVGAFSLGNVSNNLMAVSAGIAACRKIFTLINRRSPLDPTSDLGSVPSDVRGTLTLEHIKHVYPSRPQVPVFQDLTLKIPAQKTTALVGASGSGKSSIIGLIERFYEPLEGTISLDGNNVRSLNLRWLRRQMSLVGQEPVLFDDTVFENINHGLIGTEFQDQSEDARRARVMDAARVANAHDFIMQLPDGYNTKVGSRGGLLSGGQKQRIAIARAVVPDPKIRHSVLLLDEATSSLDSRSEGVVQQALDAASKGRTTIVVAHRLSTIRQADNIVISEQGTHEELLQRHGLYHGMILSQGHVSEQSPQNDNEQGSMWKVPIETGSTLEEQSRTNETQSQSPSTKVCPRTFDTCDGAKPKPKPSAWQSAKLIASYNSADKKPIAFGILFCFVCGGGTPAQAILFAKAISTLSTSPNADNQRELGDQSNLWAAMYLVLAGVLVLSHATYGVLFARCSERLLKNARSSVFRSILRQDIAFFDETQNSPGGLTQNMSMNTADIAGLSGAALGTMIISATALVAGLVVGVAIGWKLGLVCTSMVPAIVLCGYLQVWLRARFERRSLGAYAGSANYAAEAVAAIHTVASLTREAQIVGHYRAMLDAQLRASLRSVMKLSLLFSLSESATMLIMALCFWYGGTLIAAGEYSLFQYYACYASVVFSAQSAGVFFSHSASMSKAFAAAQAIWLLTSMKPVVDTWSGRGKKLVECTGHIQLRNVHFSYASRPTCSVLNGIDLDVLPGNYIAILGSSGCGKSTIISLIERFYDPTRGAVLVDGKDISTLEVNQYRAFLALVSQESTLYTGTIRDNIVLGVPDHESVLEDQILQACRDADIEDFIKSLPEGLETTVGSKGLLISGGQKQRLAIARALIRNPRVLLLDEATSALDAASERAVQASLDKAAKGRTTIVVAHRLSTIRNADCIYMLDEGRVVEHGTYGDLIRKNERFAALVYRQQSGSTL